MKNLKIVILILTFSTGFIVTNCTSSDDSNSNNNPPGLFSAYAFDARVDGASLEWTEAIDVDDDTVTYAIILEGELISAGGSSLAFNISGLEPDTIYQGYVEARDGNGGTSTADFSFVTEPQVIIFNVDASWWIKDQFPEGEGLRTALRSGFIIPYYEDATLYQIEILDYGITLGGITGNDEIGQTYTWTNDSQSTPIGSVFTNQTEPGDYAAALTGTSINTINSSYGDNIAYYESVYGEATVTIIIGN